ncbi:hypothetical protein ACFFRR_006436 [Megaselia abdita]
MVFKFPSANFTGNYSIRNRFNRSPFSLKVNDRGYFDFNLKPTRHSISFRFTKSREEGSIIIENLWFDKTGTRDSRIPSQKLIGTISKLTENIIMKLTRKLEDLVNHVLMEFMFENITEVTDELIKQMGSDGILGGSVCGT